MINFTTSWATLKAWEVFKAMRLLLISLLPLLASCSLLGSDPETITYSGKITYLEEGNTLPTTIYVYYKAVERTEFMTLNNRLLDTMIVISPDGSNEFNITIPYLEKSDFIKLELYVDMDYRYPNEVPIQDNQTFLLSEEYDYDKYIDGKLSNWAITETDQDYLDLHFILKDTSEWWSYHDHLND
jgi:hypothetical protein